MTHPSTLFPSSPPPPGPIPGASPAGPIVQAGRWVLPWNAPPPLRVGALVAGRRLRPDPPEPPDGPAGSGLDPADALVRAMADPAPGAASSIAGVARLGQVHGSRIAIADRPGFISDCDGAVTTVPGLLLTVRVADCVPVLVAGRRAVGIAHAGWRGTAAGIAGRMLAALTRLSGEEPAALAAWIGPSIGACCYRVGEEVADRFDPRLLRRDRAGIHLDLGEANREQLVAAGIPPAAIFDGAVCTRCHQHLFHSHRGSHGRPGRNEAFLVRYPEAAPAHPARLRS